MSTERTEVTELGEDTALWIVTGTTDAHSADEAVRTHVEAAVGATLETIYDADDLVELTIQHRTDWAWISLNDDASYLIHGENSRSHDQFAGYLVSAS